MTETDSESRQILADISTLRVNVASPLLLELYEDRATGILSRDDFLSVLRLIESYVFRRSICGIPTNSLDKTFASLSREIDKKRYLESIQAAFLLKDGNRKFPSDDEFRREFVLRDVYNFRNRGYLFEKLENYDHKERILTKDYSIEHIMPQNPDLSVAWQRELGDSWEQVQAVYLNTVGNLTLTGYNSEYSDRPFLEKRDMAKGFADSHLLLNHGLAKLDCWNEAEIRRRAETLADRAVKIWSAPSLPADVFARYGGGSPSGEKKTYSLDDHLGSASNHVVTMFNQLRLRILDLSSSVREDVKSVYIAYKTSTNFVDVVVQKNNLLLYLNVGFDEIHDPKGICVDVTTRSHWGNGDVELSLSSIERLSDVVDLIRQSLARHLDDDE